MIKIKDAHLRWRIMFGTRRINLNPDLFSWGVNCRANSAMGSNAAAPRPFDSNQSSDLPIVFQMTHCVLCSRIVRAHDNRSGQ
jgi:hypothetical protein